MKMFKMTDNESVIVREIQDILGVTNEEASNVFAVLKKQDYSSLSNCLLSLDNNNEGDKFITGNGLYNVSISVTTLVVICFILDIKITCGALSTILNLAGVSSKAISKISPEKGEACILKETLRTKTHIVNKRLLERNNKECVNNDIICIYRQEGKCLCSSDRVSEILTGLRDKNIYLKLDANNYRYIW